MVALEPVPESLRVSLHLGLEVHGVLAPEAKIVRYHAAMALPPQTLAAHDPDVLRPSALNQSVRPGEELRQGHEPAVIPQAL